MILFFAWELGANLLPSDLVSRRVQEKMTKNAQLPQSLGGDAPMSRQCVVERVVLLVHDDHDVHEVILFTLHVLLFMHFQNFIVLFFQLKTTRPHFWKCFTFSLEVLQCLLAFPVIHHQFFLKKKKPLPRISGKSSCLTDYFNLQTWSCWVRLHWAVLWRICPGSWEVSLSAASPSGARRQPTLWLKMQHPPPSVVHTCRGHSALLGCLCFFWLVVFFFCVQVWAALLHKISTSCENMDVFVCALTTFVWPGWAFNWATAARLVLGCREILNLHWVECVLCPMLFEIWRVLQTVSSLLNCFSNSE